MKIQRVLNSATTGALSSAILPSFVGWQNKSVCVCIIGVGYVGESLLVEFGKKFETVGYDVSADRIRDLQAKHHGDRIALTNDASELSRGTHFLIAVPTPLNADTSVDLSYIVAALETVLTYARFGSCIVIESTVPVGTTRNLLGSQKHLYHCGMSPERIDPGRTSPAAQEIPKVLSALTPRAMKYIAAIYGTVYETIVPVSKPEVAEMTKLYENCYRMINIAYVNEVSDACLAHGIDPHEMIGAAATKPFGFQPFYPGLGVGGHCIPVNPFYLFQNNKRMRVLEIATSLMLQRPTQLASKFYRACSKANGIHSKIGPRILVVGLGFKGGQSALSGSPALVFAKQLFNLGCDHLAYYDPSRGAEDIAWMERLEAKHWNRDFVDQNFNGVAICNEHAAIDLSCLAGLQIAIVKRYV